MTNLKKRERAKTNASLISMVQRFSDITIMFAGLWLVCEVSGLSFLYMHLLVALITLVVFQMLGGITDFYRSWRGVRAATEFALLLQNWTLSVIFSAGLVAFNNDFDTQLKIWLAWYDEKSTLNIRFDCSTLSTLNGERITLLFGSDAGIAR